MNKLSELSTPTSCLIYEGNAMAVAVAARTCSRCSHKGACVHIAAPLPDRYLSAATLDLCLMKCWGELCAAIESREELL